MRNIRKEIGNTESIVSKGYGYFFEEEHGRDERNGRRLPVQGGTSFPQGGSGNDAQTNESFENDVPVPAPSE